MLDVSVLQRTPNLCHSVNILKNNMRVKNSKYVAKESGKIIRSVRIVYNNYSKCLFAD